MMNEEILKRLEEIEAQAAALRRACIQAKKELGVYHELEEERTQIPCEPSYAQVLLDRALSSDAGRDLLDRLHKLERVAEAARRLREPLVRDFTGAYSRADEMLDTTDMDVCVWCEHPVDLYRDYNHAADCPWKKLQEALAALEEVE